MNLDGKYQARGKVKFTLTKADGEQEVTYIKNLVVDDGLDFIANRMIDAGRPSEMSHMGIGSGTATPAGGNSSLGTQLGRVALTSVTVTAPSIEYGGYFAPGTGTGAIVEAGIFNQSSGGIMLARTKFPVINKEAGDGLQVQWVITVTDA
jgi:hypothetical protein